MRFGGFRHEMERNGTLRKISRIHFESVGDFKKLTVWRKSQGLVGSIYRLTDSFPSQERYGLSSQMRRAAISVSANLAEGCGRHGDVELRRFVRISLGSLAELECELLLSADLQFVELTTCQSICSEIRQIPSIASASSSSASLKASVDFHLDCRFRPFFRLTAYSKAV